MPILEFTKTVDDFVEAVLHGVHERLEVRLSFDRLKVVVVSSGRGEVLGNYGDVLQAAIVGGKRGSHG